MDNYVGAWGQNQQQVFSPLICSNSHSIFVDALACSVERLSLTTATAVPPITNYFGGFADPIPVNGQFSGNTQNLRSLKDAKARLVSLAQPHATQQQHQHLGKPQVIEMILWQVKDHLCDLMMDRHCTRLIMQIFEASSVDHITRILALVVQNENKLKQVCMHNHGTLAMKKLLECLKTPEQISSVIIAVKRITVELSKTFNGGRIIQHCFKLFSPVLASFIIDEVAKNCVEIVADNIGSCVFQEYLQEAKSGAKRPFVEGIASRALVLTTHPFGNYVVQCVVRMKIPYINAMIISQICGKCAELSMNKYGSNVVECLLEFSEERDAATIIQEILYDRNFMRVVKDICGNYVVQKALKNSKGTLYKMLRDIILHNYPYLCNHPYGKRVLAFTKRGQMYGQRHK